mmetsp:Transcript_32146/g.48727  ORF Transcript_32146/g.48727 Transcript_32146/m.48727 type:complete len:91 (+) Transcript_32146:612-884(+)
MMESLTDEICSKAMEIIDEVEERGGMTWHIDSGSEKLCIKECATKKQCCIDSGEDVIVGMNKYKLLEGNDTDDEDKEEMQKVLQIDNTLV